MQLNIKIPHHIKQNFKYVFSALPSLNPQHNFEFSIKLIFIKKKKNKTFTTFSIIRLWFSFFFFFKIILKQILLSSYENDWIIEFYASKIPHTHHITKVYKTLIIILFRDSSLFYFIKKTMIKKNSTPLVRLYRNNNKNECK